MLAHVIENEKITNTIVVDSLDVFPDQHLVDAGLGGTIGDGWIDGHPVPVPVPTPEPTREQLKAARQAAVDAITVTVGEKVFDGDEISQGRMSRALTVAELTGQASCIWVLHDNTATEVTREELAQALALAMQAQAAIWVIQ